MTSPCEGPLVNITAALGPACLRKIGNILRWASGQRWKKLFHARMPSKSRSDLETPKGCRKRSSRKAAKPPKKTRTGWRRSQMMVPRVSRLTVGQPRDELSPNRRWRLPLRLGGLA